MSQEVTLFVSSGTGCCLLQPETPLPAQDTPAWCRARSAPITSAASSPLHTWHRGKRSIPGSSAQGWPRDLAALAGRDGRRAQSSPQGTAASALGCNYPPGCRDPAPHIKPEPAFPPQHPAQPANSSWWSGAGRVPPRGRRRAVGGSTGDPHSPRSASRWPAACRWPGCPPPGPG